MDLSWDNFKIAMRQQADAALSDPVGAVYRATTGKVDPWTQNEIADQGAMDTVQASNGTISYDDAYAQQSETIGEVADSQNVTWSQAAGTWLKNTINDDGSGCSLISNPAGCWPTWVPWAVAGAGLLLLLWVLRPYVVAAEEA